MPRAPREEAQRMEQGGESGDPNELMRGYPGNGGPSGISQPLPPLAHQSTQQAARREMSEARAEALAAIPKSKVFRVTRVNRNDKGEVKCVVGAGGRQFQIGEGKLCDERYYDIKGLMRQGIRFELVKDEEENQEMQQLDA
jgi:hypothetical protein